MLTLHDITPLHTPLRHRTAHFNMMGTQHCITSVQAPVQHREDCSENQKHHHGKNCEDFLPRQPVDELEPELGEVGIDMDTYSRL